MKLSDRDIAVRLLALDESETTMQDTQMWLDHWNKHFNGMGLGGHAGDCERAPPELVAPVTCSRCVYEETMKRVDIVRELFGIEEPSC